MVVDCIRDALSPRFIYERSEGEGVEREGMTPKNELVSGTLSAPCIVVENGIRFAVDLKGGQKTGFFIDQRENRVLVRRYAAGAEVADCFSYSGGFSLAALAGGAARVRSVDVSKSALALAKRNREENGFAAPDEDFIAADVFAWLREASRNFTLMVLDPPKFARHPAQRDRAARGYKDINLLALRLLRREGMLFTFSCSQAIDPRLFRQIVFGAAVDAQREVQVLHTMGQPEDHPVNIAHREGEYLTGLVLRVVGDR
jgi:23S rRNA (cytosine1962-C5)-methyltransferase